MSTVDNKGNNSVIMNNRINKYLKKMKVKNSNSNNKQIVLISDTHGHSLGENISLQCNLSLRYQ